MTLKQIMQAMGAALTDVAAIKTWVKATFPAEKNITVYLGVDPENPPDSVQTPAVFLWQPSHVVSAVSRGDFYEYMRDLRLVAWVEQPEITTVDNVIEYNGLSDSDRLFSLAWQEIINNTAWPIHTGITDTSKRIVFSTVTSEPPIMLFPHFLTYGTFSISYTVEA